MKLPVVTVIKTCPTTIIYILIIITGLKGAAAQERDGVSDDSESR